MAHHKDLMNFWDLLKPANQVSSGGKREGLLAILVSSPIYAYLS